MKTVKIGNFEYNLKSVLKKNKTDFKKTYQPINKNWETHYEELQALKK